MTDINIPFHKVHPLLKQALSSLKKAYRYLITLYVIGIHKGRNGYV